MILRLFFICYLFISVNNDVPTYVNEFHEIKTKNEELEFISKYADSKDVSVLGYVISLRMKQAKYKFMPWDKITVFRTERDNLEKLIKENPSNLHLRYLRLVIQESTPKLLNYFSSIESDKNIIKTYLQKIDNTDYLDQFIKNNTSL
jgi:hypothetical protein